MPIQYATAQAVLKVYKQAEKYRPIVTKYFPIEEVDNALAVMSLESSDNSHAECDNTNKSVDYGLFQINSMHWNEYGVTKESLADPDTNIRIAFGIWKNHGGWRNWYAAKRIDSLKFCFK